jgi:dolichol-phosphate mannosyltransferase
MKLSIIVPVFDEEQTIAAILTKLGKLSIPGWTPEILVVDDASRDLTAKKILEWTKSHPQSGMIFLTHKTNQGKGQAVRTALSSATGDYVIIQDADLEYDPAEIPLLLEKLEPPRVQVVYGSRNLNPKRRGYPLYVLGVKIITMLVNLLYGGQLTDVYTCYKLVPLAALKPLNLQSNGFEFEAELTVKLLKKGFAIREVPISYYPRKFAEGKKIGWVDEIVGIWTIIKNRL